jgi:hypothetical protein
MHNAAVSFACSRTIAQLQGLEPETFKRLAHACADMYDEVDGIAEDSEEGAASLLLPKGQRRLLAYGLTWCAQLRRQDVALTLYLTSSFARRVLHTLLQKQKQTPDAIGLQLIDVLNLVLFSVGNDGVAGNDCLVDLVMSAATATSCAPGDALAVVKAFGQLLCVEQECDRHRVPDMVRQEEERTEEEEEEDDDVGFIDLEALDRQRHAAIVAHYLTKVIIVSAGDGTAPAPAAALLAEALGTCVKVLGAKHRPVVRALVYPWLQRVLPLQLDLPLQQGFLEVAKALAPRLPGIIDDCTTQWLTWCFATQQRDLVLCALNVLSTWTESKGMNAWLLHEHKSILDSAQQALALHLDSPDIVYVGIGIAITVSFQNGTEVLVQSWAEPLVKGVHMHLHSLPILLKDLLVVLWNLSDPLKGGLVTHDDPAVHVAAVLPRFLAMVWANAQDGAGHSRDAVFILTKMVQRLHLSGLTQLVWPLAHCMAQAVPKVIRANTATNKIEYMTEVVSFCRGLVCLPLERSAVYVLLPMLGSNLRRCWGPHVFFHCDPEPIRDHFDHMQCFIEEALAAGVQGDVLHSALFPGLVTMEERHAQHVIGEDLFPEKVFCPWASALHLLAPWEMDLDLTALAAMNRVSVCWPRPALQFTQSWEHLTTMSLARKSRWSLLRQAWCAAVAR